MFALNHPNAFGISQTCIPLAGIGTHKMNDIEAIRDIDEQIFDTIEGPLAELSSTFSQTQYQKTLSTFILFVAKVDFIKNAIFDICSNEDIYSAKILYRALIEHMLKFQYLFLRFVQEKSDRPVEEYELFSDLSEDVGYAKAWLSVSKIRNDADPAEDMWEELKKIKQELASYSKKEIEEKVSQFRYKNVIAYINNVLLSDDRSGELPILKLILEYSELSSFVHAGPFANRFVLKHADETKRKQELLHVCEMAFLIATSVKEFTFLVAASSDSKYSKVVNQIANIRHANAS
jgi:hypothetical protein